MFGPPGQAAYLLFGLFQFCPKGKGATAQSLVQLSPVVGGSGFCSAEALKPGQRAAAGQPGPCPCTLTTGDSFFLAGARRLVTGLEMHRTLSLDGTG